MSKHTPTPWKRIENQIMTDDEDEIHIADIIGCSRTNRNDRYNARFIVSCINTHDDLVEALTNLRREYCQAECYGNDYGVNGVKHTNYCLAASKLLVKSKGIS